MKQLNLINPDPIFFGGELNRGKRKTRRPLCSKRPIHLVLKAKTSKLYAQKNFIENKIQKLAQRFDLSAYGIAVNFDHVHLVVRVKSRCDNLGFIRSITGVLARRFGKNLWKCLPFTRVL